MMNPNMMNASYGAVQMEVLARAIRRYALESMIVAVLAIPFGLGCFGVLVKEAVSMKGIPTGTMSMVLVALGVGAFVLARLHLRAERYREFTEPRSSAPYRAVGSPWEIVQLGGTKGRRNEVCVTLRSGQRYRLPLAREQVEPVLNFLVARAPHAQPYRE